MHPVWHQLTPSPHPPRSLRALYGTDGTQNATHGSDSPASATREIGFFFPQQSRPEVQKTFALIKPDAVMHGKAPEIMQLIELAGFTIVMKEKLQVGRWVGGQAVGGGGGRWLISGRVIGWWLLGGSVGGQCAGWLAACPSPTCASHPRISVTSHISTSHITHYHHSCNSHISDITHQ